MGELIDAINIQINLMDYVSAEEIKEAILDQVKQSVKCTLCSRNDIEDFLSDLSYKFVWNIVDDVLKEDNKNLSESISEKVIEIINNLSTYSVFRKAGEYYGQTLNSVGQDILEQSVLNEKEHIKQRVSEIIDQYDFPQLERDEIPYIIGELLTERIFRKDEEYD